MYNSRQEIYDDYRAQGDNILERHELGQITNVQCEVQLANLLEWYEAELQEFSNSEHLFPGED